ncbi:hypothetical protein D3C72_2218540 [compost metagenome]
MQLFDLIQKLATEAFQYIPSKQRNFSFVHRPLGLGVFANPRRLQNEGKTC